VTHKVSKEESVGFEDSTFERRLGRLPETWPRSRGYASSWPDDVEFELTLIAKAARKPSNVDLENLRE
jgi:hypothetical protein